MSRCYDPMAVRLQHQAIQEASSTRGIVGLLDAYVHITLAAKPWTNHLNQNWNGVLRCMNAILRPSLIVGIRSPWTLRSQYGHLTSYE